MAESSLCKDGAVETLETRTRHETLVCMPLHVPRAQPDSTK